MFFSETMILGNSAAFEGSEATQELSLPKERKPWSSFAHGLRRGP
jgi:hypothetical protein